MAHTWDPTQYLQYSLERERPFWDLVARVQVPRPLRVVDLGCGPGTATTGLLDHWPDATVVGIDNSPAMIDEARTHHGRPRLTFELGDLTSWEPGPATVDVILSNAALQWVPSHVDLFDRWLSGLRPHGVFAFQVPGNSDAPSHSLLADLARSPAWRDQLTSASHLMNARTPAEYHQCLRDLGAAVDMWETTYYHLLTGADPILEWLRGSALRPYLDALDPGDAVSFTRTYATALRAAYPPLPDGRTLFPFRRVFVVATVP